MFLRKDSYSLLLSISFVVVFTFGYIIYNEPEISEQVRNLIELQRHKDLFPFNQSDIWGSIAVTLGLLVAASGGIGGGGILVPLFILIFGFGPKYAVALSNFCILGSSITNMILNIPKRHPFVDRPLVDWDLILVMEPLTMAGAVVGAFVSKVLPDWLLVISLVLLLAFTTWTTLQKGFEQYKKESRVFEEQKKSILLQTIEKEEEDSETQNLIQDQEEKHSHNIDDMLVNPELTKLVEKEKTTPWDKVLLVSTMIGVVIILNLLKGGGETFPSPLGIECGSNGYWFLTALVFIWILGVSYSMRKRLIENWKLKKSLHYRYIEGDVEWNPSNTIIYPCICFFAGFFAGMFGVGGGIVKGPLMLYMGVHPLVASATCAVMIMFTSVAATTMFIAFGTLTWDYAWYFFFMGLIATVVGQFGVSYLVKKYNRYSLVSLSIGAVVALSTILMAVQSVFSLVDSDSSKSSSSVCGK